MKDNMYQPTDSTGGGKLVNMEIAWVKITFDVAYCNLPYAKVKIVLDTDLVLEGQFYPGKVGVSFEELVYPRHVEYLNFILEPDDWTCAINNVTTEWSDAEQAPGEPPLPPEPGVVTIPLTLLIPSIPEPPPEDDDGLWPSISSWITEYWWVIAVGIVVMVIGTYAFVRYK